MKIAVACDHGGINLKEDVINTIISLSHESVDFGCYSTDSVDYPVFAKKAADAVASGECDLGILLCGTGIGMSIAANKVKGIRCGHVTTAECASLTKEHNNANMIALGGRITTNTEAVEIVKAFLTTEFAGGRHQNRVNMIMDLEK